MMVCSNFRGRISFLELYHSEIRFYTAFRYMSYLEQKELEKKQEEEKRNKKGNSGMGIDRRTAEMIEDEFLMGG